jgi:hypothetical protein
MQIAVTNAAGNGSHQNLAILRAVDLYIFDRERLFRTVKNCGFHRQTP